MVSQPLCPSMWASRRARAAVSAGDKGTEAEFPTERTQRVDPIEEAGRAIDIFRPSAGGLHLRVDRRAYRRFSGESATSVSAARAPGR